MALKGMESSAMASNDVALNVSLLSSDLNNFWMLFGVVLVFIMQIGFAMLEVGSVNIKNTKNILAKNLIDASIITLVWWSIGHSIAFEGSNKDGSAGGFMGSGNYFQSHSLPTIQMSNEAAAAKTTASHSSNNLTVTELLLTNPAQITEIMATHSSVQDSSAFFLYQWAFCINSCTIVAGAVAERIKLEAYFVYAVVFGLVIYPPVAHWVWSKYGWASIFASNSRTDILGIDAVGVIDFAGSGVVHMTGGLVALVGAKIIGPRKGRFNEAGEAMPMPTQSVTFQVLGTMLMWVGWYGFNACSTLGLTHGNGVVGVKAVFNTTMAGAAACLSTALLTRWAHGSVDIAPVCNGLLGGMVAITAGCATVDAAGAIIIGLVAGLVYFLSSRLLLRLQIDDVVDGSPVHYACGLWGVLAACIFSTPLNFRYVYRDAAHESCGILYSCKSYQGGQLSVTLLFILVHFLWVGSVALLTFVAMKTAGILREDADSEELGMDISRHNGEAYQISTIAVTMDGGPQFEFPDVDDDVPVDALGQEERLAHSPAVPFGSINSQLGVPRIPNSNNSDDGESDARSAGAEAGIMHPHQIASRQLPRLGRMPQEQLQHAYIPSAQV